jgi:hypothetical protein
MGFQPWYVLARIAFKRTPTPQEYMAWIYGKWDAYEKEKGIKYDKTRVLYSKDFDTWLKENYKVVTND